MSIAVFKGVAVRVVSGRFFTRVILQKWMACLKIGITDTNAGDGF